MCFILLFLFFSVYRVALGLQLYVCRALSLSAAGLSYPKLKQAKEIDHRNEVGVSDDNFPPTFHTQMSYFNNFAYIVDRKKGKQMYFY